MPIETTILTGASAALASSATKEIFQSAVQRVEKFTKGPARTLAIRAIASLQGYSSYIEETHRRVSIFKTFANPAAPVSLIDHFVMSDFSKGNGKKLYDQEDLINQLNKDAKIVISATAGYGKSMSMRYISLIMYERPNGKIPLFLELRHLNRVTSPNIISYLHGTYNATSSVDIESFSQGLEYGSFCLILDGFDELNHEIRPIIESQILELSRKYNKCSIIVSGRPDDRFGSWRTFSIFKMRPMSQNRVVELITKLEYDSGVKKGLFQK